MQQPAITGHTQVSCLTGMPAEGVHRAPTHCTAGGASWCQETSEKSQKRATSKKLREVNNLNHSSLIITLKAVLVFIQISHIQEQHHLNKAGGTLCLKTITIFSHSQNLVMYLLLHSAGCNIRQIHTLVSR